MQLIEHFRLYIKRRFDGIRNEKFKINVLQAIPFWLASIFTGVVAVLYTRMFSWAENLMTSLFEWHNWVIFIQAPVFIIIGWWVVQKFAPYAKGSGIPQVMAATALVSERPNTAIEKLLSMKVAVVKIISSLFLAVGGAAIGREGPTIQISGSIFKFVYTWIPKSWPKLERANMIVAGAAAGLAAAFNTPLGGIVFAVEELSRTHISFYRTALFSAVIIAGLSAQAMLGPYLYLGYPAVSGTSWYIFFPIIVVAIIGGFAGSYMCHLILRVLRWKSATFTKTSHHILFLLGCAFILALLTYFISPVVTGSGKELMQHMLFTADKDPHWYDFPLRFIGPLLSFTTGGAGGVFAPGLTTGATLGALVGHWFNLLPADVNLLILAGMVAFLTGITRTPFTSAILVLEMTDRHSVIFHLMLAGMIAGLASLLVDKESFYDHLKHDYLKQFKEEEEQESPEVIEVSPGVSPA